MTCASNTNIEEIITAMIFLKKMIEFHSKHEKEFKKKYLSKSS